ncbi:hypothetical protein PPYR_00898 [Photinus pyralis]|uniref:mRNA export factor GLE1 n=1 Tax=Photinus pyralis TaxID=7054 RepID=A0A1Y1MHF6_PHOPY|nr:nucleoporin GLE1 [Photinus pyralis]KAB0803928.1 hypothetical protein PPYR_00898 [Photinus pyralis]
MEINLFKTSALTKSRVINCYVTNTTIGPSINITDNLEDCRTFKDACTQTIIPLMDQKPNLSTVLKSIRQEYEKNRQREVQESVKARINSMAEFSKRNQLDTYKILQEKQKIILNERHQQELRIIQKLEQHDKDSVSLQQQHLLRYYEEMNERKKKLDKEVKEYERHKKVKAIIDKIKTDQIEFRQVYQEINETFQQCKYPHELKIVLGDITKQLNLLPDAMEEIIKQCKTYKVSERESVTSGQLVQRLKAVLEDLKRKISEVQQAKETRKKEEQKSKVIDTQSRTEVLHTNIKPTEMDKIISKNSLHTYMNLQKFLVTFTSSYDGLVKDERLKNFKRDCKNAVNIPVNAISAVTSQHLLDKYLKLSHLLEGKRVEVGDTYITATQHPQGIAYCTNLLANKFVLQGDVMISSKPDAAFAYGATITALWYANENFGKLLLAHFHKQCPYLVPFYPPQTVGQDDKDYYVTLGYQYKNNVIEKQDKFLKRMAGIMRLYAAIIITRPKKGQRNLHGISEGWRWLSAILNLEPKPDITATLLLEFFETAGSTMGIAYGTSFRKLMKFVCSVYFPSIQKIDKGGPVSRLELLLQDYVKLGRFEEPQGILPNNFW